MKVKLRETSACMSVFVGIEIALKMTSLFAVLRRFRAIELGGQRPTSEVNCRPSHFDGPDIQRAAFVFET